MTPSLARFDFSSRTGTWTMKTAMQTNKRTLVGSKSTYLICCKSINKMPASLHRIEHRVPHISMLLPLPFAALVKLERNVALVLEVYLAGASVNVILRVWASCSKSGITTTNKSKARNLPMRT